MNKQSDRFDLNVLSATLPNAEKPQTLFRFPGPCGLQKLSHGQLKTLAPEELETVFLFKDRYNFYHKGIEAFGIFAVANDEKFGAVCLDNQALKELNYADSDRGRIYLGWNKPIVEEANFIWITPEMYNSKDQWAQINFNEVKAVTSSKLYQEQKSRAFEDVNNYMEEVAQVEAAVGPRSHPWYLLETEERRKIIAAAQLNVRWSSNK